MKSASSICSSAFGYHGTLPILVFQELVSGISPKDKRDCFPAERAPERCSSNNGIHGMLKNPEEERCGRIAKHSLPMLVAKFIVLFYSRFQDESFPEKRNRMTKTKSFV
jgi:hypothetical protein